MKITLCDCCKRQLRDTEKIYSMKIISGGHLEMDVRDVCIDCYDRIKQVVDKAEFWRKNSV